MGLRVEVDATNLIQDLNEAQKTALPYALARSLTMTAQDAQKEVRRGLQQKFTLRNDWTERGIRIKPADKNRFHISADVHTDTENRKTHAPDYLGLQEEGGEKIHRNGRPHFAVPTRYLRQIAPGPIPAELRPRNLLGAVGGRFVRYNKKNQIVLSPQRKVNGFEFFIQKDRKGKEAIFGRYFTEREAYPFYLLIPAAHVRPALHMDRDVRRVVDERFVRNWDLAWREILAKGLRLKG